MGYAGRWAVGGLLVAMAAQAPGRAAEGAIVGRWLGQDRHDYCGAVTNAVAPNGVQDVHIALGGLPARREILSAEITGHGSGAWQYKGTPGQYAATLLRRPGSPQADVYFEPQQAETGREFCVKLRFDDGAVVDVYLKGGKADPHLPMPGAALQAKWAGQERQDHTGAGPAVGPDGLQDVRIALSKVAANEKIAEVAVEDAGGSRWVYGPNPEGHHNAEFVRDPKVPTEGNLFFHPDRDLTGRKLKVTVTYETGKKNSATVTAGRSDPRLAMPAGPAPRLAPLAATARWLGQDGAALTGPGDVHVAVAGLSASKTVAAAVLSDSVRGVWVFRAGDRPPLDVEAGAAPLVFKPGPGRTTADLYFPPIRDETGAAMTLRLVYPDGTAAYATFPGGACDPNRRAPTADRSETAAKPGDDLAALAGRSGTVRLGKGEYVLKAPLVLTRPVALVGEPGTVLKFAQGAGDAPWTAAIKVHAGGTTLRGFAVRFAGPVRWKQDVSWGPAVIGTTDNFDTVPSLPKANLTFEGLDLESPPASGKEPWEEATKLLRAHNATSGRFARNTLRGGVVELFEGPWQVVDNVSRGTPPKTFSHGVFTAHDPHDLVVKNNRTANVGPSGKTWRFLVLTHRGVSDRVEDNVIEGVGPRDDDTIPGANAPETILTEAYHLWFEGKPAAVSADGRVVKLPRLPGPPARTGDVLAVLSGTGAGEWRRVAQRIEPTVYLLDAPLPRGAGVVSIASGFVNDVYSGNRIDARGGRAVSAFVLAGNHYGTRVVNNRIVGAGDAWQLTAFPSESPGIWGWSHAPYLGGVVEGNTIEDSERGGQAGVVHGGISKSNKGRVYMTLTLKGNTVRWTEPFLDRTAQDRAKKLVSGLTLGFEKSLDPGELVVTESGDRLDAPARAPASTALRVNAALLNGRVVTNRSLPLPTAGASASAGVTRPRG